MLGTIMFLSKLIMEFLPNIHLVGTLIAVCTIVYRKKALIPIYIYVLLVGVYGGFNWWWMPYIYIWAILFLMIMIIPKDISEKKLMITSPILTALHGLMYGILYAPAQAIMFDLNPQQTLAWIVAGVPFDLLHGAGNLILGFLIYPLTRLVTKLSAQIGIL
jgi:energy-coupling factor transport system substrate-specific component